MSSSPISNSLSIYRGQSRTGIGEGPGSAISHGEQYLHAEADLAADATFLRTIRPWMTLDADPADLRKLGDRLEAWSAFEADGRFFVTRLVPAGVYDRRAAYFAHGRSFAIGDNGFGPDGFDPGLLLGYSGAFEEPWRDEPPGTRHYPPDVPEEAFRVRLHDDRPRIAGFLAHLFQAMVEQRPLVIAAPLEEFVVGGTLAASLCLARAALPADLKRRCRIRVYTSQPERFLRHHGAHLVAVPEKLAADAIRARPEAVLLDHLGQCRSRFDLDERVSKYAETVSERMVQTPEGLIPFSTRYAARHRRNGAELPSPSDRGTLVLIYNLAFGLTGSEQRREALLRDYLIKTARKSDLPWDELIDSREWAGFPDTALTDLLLETDEVASTRSLQALAEQAVRAFPEDRLRRVRALLEERLPSGGNGMEPNRQRRLLELFSRQLVSYDGARSSLAAIPLSRIEEFGLLPQVLHAEMEAGVLAQRSRDPSLVEIARQDRDVVKVLAEATSRGRLDPAWAEALLGEPARCRAALFALAEHLLGDPESWDRWNDFFLRLLDTLRTSSVEASLWGPFFDQLGRSLEGLQNHPLALVRLAEIQVVHGSTSGLLADRLRRDRDNALAILKDRRDQEEVVSLALRDDWRSITPADLCPGKDQFRWPWLTDHMDKLLDFPEVLDRLSTRFIVRALESGSSSEKLLAALDHRMTGEPAETTRALIESGWWPTWRRRLGGLYDPRTSARAWLECPAWQEERHSSRLPTRETWAQVLQDLGDDGLSWETTRLLFQNRRPTWLIPPFEIDQLEELAEKATDLDTLAELAEGVDECCDEIAQEEDVGDLLVQKSRFQDRLSGGDLLWLIDQRHRRGRRPRDLDLETSLELCLHTRSQQRRQSAIDARIGVILRLLETQPLEALHAANVHGLNLWEMKEKGFLDGLAEWMSRSKSVDQLGGRNVATAIGELLEPDSTHRHRASCHSLVRDLQQQGYEKAARFLAPETPKLVDSELAEQVLAALSNEWSDDHCWRKIRTLIRESKDTCRPQDHPFFGIADALRSRPLASCEIQTLAATSWSTFSKAASARELFCFYAKASSDRTLPAFDLMTSVTPRGTLGILALGIVFSEGSQKFQADPGWWKSLVLGMLTCRRSQGLRGTQDRPEVALALLMSRKRDLSHNASQAMNQALLEMEPDWPLISELGVTRDD